MTPLGHLSVSFLAGKSSKKFVLSALLVGGLLPDIDFVLLPFPFFNQVHRVLTHNLLFVSIAALSIAFLRQSAQQKRLWIFWGALLGGLLHILADSCLDSNASNGIGVALCWPFSDAFFSPLNLLTPRAETVGWAAPLDLLQGSFLDLVPELPFWGLAALLALKDRFKTSRSGP